MTQDARERFGEYIKRLRTNRKLSIRELARKTGMHSGNLSRLECGGAGEPRVETLRRLSQALDVPVTDLLEMTDSIQPYDVPGIATYLRAYYGYLPEDKLEAINSYIERVLDEYDDEYEHMRRGPLPGEDELDGLSEH